MRRVTVLLLAAAGVGALAIIALATYSAVELHRFRRAEVGRATLIYAAPQALQPGVDVRRIDLAGTLGRLRYRETRGAPAAPGEYRRAAGAWDIYLRRVDRGRPQPAPARPPGAVGGPGRPPDAARASPPARSCSSRRC